MNEVLGKIGFDWQLAIVNFINIFLIFLVLKKWAFGPIQEIITKRRLMVENSLEEAEKAKGAREAAEEDKKEALQQAKQEAQSIIAGAEEQAKGIVERGKADAMKEHSDALHKAQLEIEAERKQAEAQVKKEAAALITGGVRKILGKEVTASVDETIIQSK